MKQHTCAPVRHNIFPPIMPSRRLGGRSTAPYYVGVYGLSGRMFYTRTYTARDDCYRDFRFAKRTEPWMRLLYIVKVTPK